MRKEAFCKRKELLKGELKRDIKTIMVKALKMRTKKRYQEKNG